jgi:flagellar basal-body rod protein FlgB
LTTEGGFLAFRRFALSQFGVDPLISGLHTVLNLRAKQHALTATNLANIDTPGYHAQVINFENALAQAIGTNGESLTMSVSNPDHISATSLDTPEILTLDPPEWAQNDNSVVLERENARMAENSLLYRGVAKGLSTKLAMLKYAASDGRG